MSIVPSRCQGQIFEGKYSFRAVINGFEDIEDEYELRIKIPANFPREIPTVVEIGGKIPRKPFYHINDDETLCMGSKLRILEIIAKRGSLYDFSIFCLTPYLYSVSHKLRNGGRFPSGELAHGAEGTIDDYKKLLRLQNRDQIKEALKLAGTRRRIAEKRTCPCGCGRRLGQCSFNDTILRLRKMASRGLYLQESNDL